MKNISNPKLINKLPRIFISNEGIKAIKHIVSIAPEEAQWFHTLETIEGSENSLYLSTKLYIPKQTTGTVEVDSSGSMLIEFYNELKEEYKDQSIVNQKLSTMTCWCHSHHNMGVNPSGQDINQFKFFIDSSIAQNQKTWQLMLIFNKSGDYYSRLYDPHTGLLYEGLSLEILDHYDFSYIDEAAATKFIKKPKINKNELLSLLDNNHFFTRSKGDDLSEIINDFKSEFYSKKRKAKLSVEKAEEATMWLVDTLPNREIQNLYFILSNQHKELIHTYTQKAFNKYHYDEVELIKNMYVFFQTTKESSNFVLKALLATLKLEDFSSNKPFKDYIKYIL